MQKKRIAMMRNRLLSVLLAALLLMGSCAVGFSLAEEELPVESEWAEEGVSEVDAFELDGVELEEAEPVEAPEEIVEQPVIDEEPTEVEEPEDDELSESDDEYAGIDPEGDADPEAEDEIDPEDAADGDVIDEDAVEEEILPVFAAGDDGQGKYPSYIEVSTISVGLKETFTISYAGTDIEGKSVELKSKDKKIAIAEVNDAERTIVVTGLKAGKSTKIDILADGAKVKTITAKVLKAAAKIWLSTEGQVTIPVGYEYPMTVSLPKKTATQVFVEDFDSSFIAYDGKTVKALAEGSTTLTVTNYDGTKQSNCVITVCHAPDSIRFEETPENTLTMAKGQKLQLTPILENCEADAAKLNLYTFNKPNKKLMTIGAKGLLTAKGTGSVDVIATTYNDKQVTVKVTLMKAPSKVTGVPKTLAMGLGEKFQLFPEVNSGAYTPGFTYTTGKKTVATVDGDGIIEAVGVSPKKKGTAKITAKAFNKKSAACTVTVKNAPTSDDMVLSATDLVMGVGEDAKLGLSFINNTAAAGVTWTSSDEGVVTVEGGQLHATGIGEAVITAEATYNGASTSCKVTVKSAPAAIHFIENGVEGTDAQTISLYVGMTYPLKWKVLNAEDSDYAPQNVASIAISNKKQRKLVSVNAAGLVKGKKKGKAVVTFTTYNKKTATCTVNVLAAPKKLLMPQTLHEMKVGETFPLMGDSAVKGITYTVTPATGVIEVDDDGLVTAVGEGKATVVASYKKVKSAACTITVKPQDAPEPPDEPDKPISEGSDPEKVKEIQQLLVSLELLKDGEYTEGVYDAATEKAVKDFQTWANMEATGVVDSETLDKIKVSEAAGEKPGTGTPVEDDLALGDGEVIDANNGSAEDVKKLQDKLVALELLKDGEYTEGVYDAATEKAVKDFQTWANMEATGVVDSETLDKIKVSEAAGEKPEVILPPTNGDFIIDNGVVTGYTGTDTNVVIPEMDVVANVAVTAIGTNAFKETDITSVTIASGVTEIQASAFEGCASLESVVIPNGVTTIGKAAFKNCTSLKTMTTVN